MPRMSQGEDLGYDGKLIRSLIIEQKFLLCQVEISFAIQTSSSSGIVENDFFWAWCSAVATIPG
ncbi:MAG: hypothetical protein H6667_15715 [Ardenticatenaceae bacterium]|nr:hypothetical protein [Ardenticatenaceae bacterium]